MTLAALGASGTAASEQVEGLRSPPRRGVEANLVRRDVDGVQRLPVAGVARVAGGEQPVGVGEPAVDPEQERGVEPPRAG